MFKFRLEILLFLLSWWSVRKRLCLDWRKRTGQQKIVSSMFPKNLWTDQSKETRRRFLAVSGSLDLIHCRSCPLLIGMFIHQPSETSNLRYDIMKKEIKPEEKIIKFRLDEDIKRDLDAVLSIYHYFKSQGLVVTVGEIISLLDIRMAILENPERSIHCLHGNENRAGVWWWPIFYFGVGWLRILPLGAYISYLLFLSSL